MRSPKLIVTAAWLALAGTGLAFPSLDKFLPRQAEDPATTTTTPAAAVDTTPTPDAGSGNHKAGHEFAMCSNLDGEFKPFCLPKENETIVPNVMKFITWDPTFFPAVNHTVKILGFYVTADSDTDQAFDSGPLESGWGFYQWDVNGNMLRGRKGDKSKTTTVTIRLAAMPKDGSGPAKWFQGPTVTLTKKKPKQQPKTQGPDDQALYIAMPIIFVAIMLIVGSVLCCNRQHRQVILGGVGGKSRGSARLERAARKHREQYIRLMDQQESGQSPTVGFRDSDEWEAPSSSRRKGKKA
ncbi:hypothetical protein QBC44DRAFT_245199 [Cladorrhinum sp. PSN332]|nr:hypothetical protein QBC44DRAFT_245199 [Cladorrhinum sp. PSN332]